MDRKDGGCFADVFGERVPILNSDSVDTYVRSECPVRRYKFCASIIMQLM